MVHVDSLQVKEHESVGFDLVHDLGNTAALAQQCVEPPVFFFVDLPTKCVILSAPAPDQALRKVDGMLSIGWTMNTKRSFVVCINLLSYVNAKMTIQLVENESYILVLFFLNNSKIFCIIKF